MHHFSRSLLIAVLLSLAAIPALADIERNPGSRSGAIDPEDPHGSGTSPYVGSMIQDGSQPRDVDMSMMRTILLNSMARVAAFDFQQAAEVVWQKTYGEASDQSTSDASYSGPVEYLAAGTKDLVDGQGDNADLSDDSPLTESNEEQDSGIMETGIGSLYDKPFVPEYEADDELEPTAEIPEIDYPTRPQDSALDRQIEQMAPGMGAWPGLGSNDQQPQRDQLIRSSLVDQAGIFIPAITTGSAVLVNRLPGRAPEALHLNDYPPRMPGESVSPRIRSLSRGNPQQKLVALTFDDGPHPEYTSQLLAILDAYDVKATFFFVGLQCQKYPGWVRMTHQAGHEIASQTYDHFRMPKLPREEKVYQIDEYQRLIEGLVGVTPRFLRPPGGQLDPVTEQLVSERGMVLGLWDVALNDTSHNRTAAEMMVTAKREVRPGSVILAHDGIAATVEMLPELIEYLLDRGYQFVTMTEMAASM